MVKNTTPCSTDTLHDVATYGAVITFEVGLDMHAQTCVHN